MPELVVTAERPNNRHRDTAEQLLNALIDRGGGGGSYDNKTDSNRPEEGKKLDYIYYAPDFRP